MPILSSIIWLPIIGGCVLMLLDNRQSERAIKFSAFSFAFATLILSLQVALMFDSNVGAMQFVEEYNWLSSLNIHYALGVDGFALPLVILTCFMTLLVIISSWYSIKHHIAKYLALFLIMQGFLCGIFMSLDAILFYIFLEAMLIPMFLIIGVWGGDNRVHATIKFFLYTFLGSVFLLIAILFLHHKAQNVSYLSEQSFAIASFSKLNLDLNVQKWLFVAFLLAFAIKIPMCPLHTWLPAAHVEAPTGGSVILAAITLKVGGYGFLRFLMPIAPKACILFAPIIILFSLIAICYIGFIAIVQKNMKKLIAYSSISHMGFVTLGLFVALIIARENVSVDSIAMGIEGAYVQMISHGFISGALFLCVGVLFARAKSHKIEDYGGVVNTMPIFASFFMLFALANIGLPGTSGFVGEFLVILATFKASPSYAVFAALILILGASYTLWMYKRVFFGEVKNQQVALLTDLRVNEKITFTLLAFVIILFGVWPNLLLNIVHKASHNLVGQVVYSIL